MVSRWLLVAMLSLLPVLCGVAVGSDLYVVEVSSQDEATKLSRIEGEVVARLGSRYLVLADHENSLNMTHISHRLLATNIERSELAIDRSPDQRFAGQLPVIYERGNLKVLRVNPMDYSLSARLQGLTRIPKADINFEYVPPRPFNWRSITSGVDLDSLINLIVSDSLQSYSNRLEAFSGRVAGTDSNMASADWVYTKFEEFGYDSIYTDTFTADIWGQDGLCKNIVAVKIGSSNPGKQVVVCAHRDAVPGSPGADDNGSGTASVLELARVLKNIPTDITYSFVSLDAEEAGLYGAFNFANKAAADGDTIVYALNSDMIGYLENTNQAKSRYWGDSTYAVLWSHLADSLLGLTGEVVETGSSDHIAFYFMGYRNSGIQEFEFSPYYHSPHDSTVYLSYDYMAIVAKANLATAYVVNFDAILPGISFAYPDGQPEYLTPGTANEIEVLVGTWGSGQIVPGSCELHFSVNSGPWTAADLAHVSGNMYRIGFPPVSCGDFVDYYLTAEEASSGVYSDADSSKPHRLPAASSLAITFEDDFSTNKPWIVYSTAINGEWERCRPSTNFYYKSVGTDYDHNDHCFVTGCDYTDGDVDDGYTELVSPVFNASDYMTRIQFASWFFNEVPGGYNPQDSMVVYWSGDGGLNWSSIDTIGPDEMNDRKWYVSDLWLPEIAQPTGHMRLKFTASDIGIANTVEAAIDAVKITAFTCDYVQPPLCGDADGSENVDIDDVVFLIDYIFAGGSPPEPLESGDADCSGAIDIDDVVYLISYIFSGGPEPCDLNVDGLPDC